jgi:hypothetical protein
MDLQLGVVKTAPLFFRMPKNVPDHGLFQFRLH